MYLFYFYLDFSYAGITNPFSYLMNSNIEFPCKYGDNITTQKENIIEITEEIDLCYNKL